MSNGPKINASDEQVAVELPSRLPSGSSLGFRSILKEGIFWSYINLVRSVPRRVLGWRNRQRIIILTYHRVNDELRDKVTVGVQQFDEQMKWLSRNYPMVSVEDILRGAVSRNIGRPAVAITFDDGYLDNHENAVPILRKYGVPAVFFVSTGMIGTNNGFAHDLNKLGRALPNMSWEHLAKMRDAGFTIGAHTVTHINCATNDFETVSRELIESRDTLREKLDLDEIVFAYPFGGRSDMAPRVLEFVKELGYIGCFSAYGGCVTGAIDPFDVPRMGIHCDFTMLAFRARLEGLNR
jgi:peptidoglycan/xylan/chitin deacetylase (PgdA/CDA1 family)